MEAVAARLAARLRHLANANTRIGSRKNIAFHYDLGNSFYECWLDPSMSYSSALYAVSFDTLEDAQARKIKRIEELLDINGNSEVLEIGCGWGALAIALARRCRSVRGVTLSAEQRAFANSRVGESGLAGKVAFELRDYRDITGSFDRIVSIEMVEAVGEAFWPNYFQALYDRLRPGGTALLQAITIDESRFISYRQSPDFIQRHVFPGRHASHERGDCAGGRESWARIFVLRAFRRELRADACRVAAGVSWHRGNRLKQWASLNSFRECGTTT